MVNRVLRKGGDMLRIPPNATQLNCLWWFTIHQPIHHVWDTIPGEIPSKLIPCDHRFKDSLYRRAWNFLIVSYRILCALSVIHSSSLPYYTFHRFTNISTDAYQITFIEAMGGSHIGRYCKDVDYENIASWRELVSSRGLHQHVVGGMRHHPGVHMMVYLANTSWPQSEIYLFICLPTEIIAVDAPTPTHTNKHFAIAIHWIISGKLVFGMVVWTLKHARLPTHMSRGWKHQCKLLLWSLTAAYCLCSYTNVHTFILEFINWLYILRWWLEVWPRMQHFTAPIGSHVALVLFTFHSTGIFHF